MSRVLYSAAARQDLAEIRSFTSAAFGADQAKRYIDRIRTRCQAVREGRLRTQLSPTRDGLRFHRSGSHLVFHYVGRNDDLHVVRILHRRMQFENHL